MSGLGKEEVGKLLTVNSGGYLKRFIVAFLIYLPIRLLLFIGQLPRVSGEDPERIRVDSVVETLVLCLSANFLIFCTIKYYSVPKQYSAVPVRVYL